MFSSLWLSTPDRRFSSAPSALEYVPDAVISVKPSADDLRMTAQYSFEEVRGVTTKILRFQANLRPETDGIWRDFPIVLMIPGTLARAATMHSISVPPRECLRVEVVYRDARLCDPSEIAGCQRTQQDPIARVGFLWNVFVTRLGYPVSSLFENSRTVRCWIGSNC